MLPISLLPLVAALTAAAPQSGDDFEWRRAIPAGKSIEIVGVNGSIDASGTPGSEVVVKAVKTGRRNDPEDVEIRVVEHADGVTICAVYPSGSRRGEPNVCRPGGKSSNNVRNNDVEVEWTVQVPRGVSFIGRTVNGDIEAGSLTAPAESYTVNGNVWIETTSWASGATVNGWIRAKMGETSWTGDAEFDTVNGRISVELPANASMEVRATTVNGSLDTDFPLTVKGRWGPRHVSGTVGGGGRTLSLSTVNGDLELRKR